MVRSSAVLSILSIKALMCSEYKIVFSNYDWNNIESSEVIFNIAKYKVCGYLYRENKWQWPDSINKSP